MSDIWNDIYRWREEEKKRRRLAKMTFDKRMQQMMRSDIELVVNNKPSHVNWKHYE